MTTSRRTWGLWAAATIFFVLLAAVALHPLMAHLTTHLPGTPRQPTTDFFHFHWNYWWIGHALAEPDLNVYETNYVFAPYTSSLALHTLTPFWYPLWALITRLYGPPIVGTIPAMAAIMAASMALSGLATFALLRRYAVSTGLALAGGSLMAISPIMRHGVFWTNPNLMGWFWPPALLLIWDRVTREQVAGHVRAAAGWSLLLGGALYGMALTDLQMFLLVSLLVIPFGLRTLITCPGARTWLIGWAAVAAASALMLIWWAGPLPALLHYERGTGTSMPADLAVSVAFPKGFVWRITGHVATVSFGAVILPLTGLALALSLAARRARPRVMFPAGRWSWLALVPAPLILSAGASITVLGVEIPLPYRLLHEALGGMFRYPERFATVATLPALVFALQTLTPLAARLRRGWRLAVPVILLLAVFADGRLYDPVPIRPAPTRYAIYDQIGQEPYDYVVLEVPTGASSGEGLVGEAEYATLQWYGLAHGKRMINGHVSRVDAMHYWLMRTDDPALAWLGQRRLYDPDAVPVRLREIIITYPVGYVMVHTDMIARYTGESTVREVIRTLNSMVDLLCPVAEEGALIAYRTAWHPDGCPPRTPTRTAPGIYVLDLGAPGDSGFLGEGWWWAETIVPGVDARWTGDGPSARLYLALPPGEYRVTVNAQAYDHDRALTLYAGGRALGTETIPAEALSAAVFDLPAAFSGRMIALDLEAGEPVQASAERALALMGESLRFERVGD